MKRKDVKRMITGILIGCAFNVPVCAEPLTTTQLVDSYLAQDRLETMQAENVPAEVEQAAEKYGAEYCIAPEFIQAVAWQESRFTATAENGPCKGVMQVNITAHGDRMERLGVTDIWDVDSNIHVAVDYLAELFEEHEDPGIVLLHYNGDGTNLKNGRISKYAHSILELSACYERRDGK